MDEKDTAKDAPACYVFTKITIDNFEGHVISDEDLQQFAEDMALSWTGQAMTASSLVTYQSFPVKDYYFVDEKGDLKEEK